MANTIQKLLVANRGEIACRVMRTAKALGIQTVAVYSDADKNAKHVEQADEAVCVGPAPSKDSYLNMEAIFSAAGLTGADAVHPGYGFLSENARFAEACLSRKLIFVGPPADAIRAMGSKSAAKQIMEQAGVPLLPGYHGDNQDPATLKNAADNMGYPVLLKAVSGGGGKGMRRVNTSEEFEAALATAKREAMSSFADDVMLVEKFLTSPRHVEVQVFCDQHGSGVYLFERDFSVQRRHQKIIEEAPAPGLSDVVRQSMGEAAVRAAEAIGYVGAGTVEFLLDEDGTFYFMEMNTRLQVEHPVTEYITGQDLVAWQIAVANGEPLPAKQAEVSIHGHAFEARIYAEDADNDFLPQTGQLTYYREPSASKHVRVDSGVRDGDEVSVYYDPMIAKLIVWDENRDMALSRLRSALDEFHIAGVTTNNRFLRQLAAHSSFAAADLSTAFLEDHREGLFQTPLLKASDVMLMALFVVLNERQKSTLSDDPWSSLSDFRLNAKNQMTQTIKAGGELYDCCLTSLKPRAVEISLGNETGSATADIVGEQLCYSLNGTKGVAHVCFDGSDGKLFVADRQVEFTVPAKDLGDDSAYFTDDDFRAPMNATVVSVAVQPGDEVKAGMALIVMEAMKMEHVIHAPSDGRVTEIFCQTGQLVDGGASLLTFEKPPEKDKEKGSN
jgi:3-methylcrotonyl-CoA carboxylase alpha subunit